MSEPVCVFHGPDCRGRLQWHHVVPRQRIRRAWKSEQAAHRRGENPYPWPLYRALNDDRNRVWLCVFHHGQVEMRKLYVDPPESAREFAREYGLEWSLEADARRGSVRSGEAA